MVFRPYRVFFPGKALSNHLSENLVCVNLLNSLIKHTFWHETKDFTVTTIQKSTKMYPTTVKFMIDVEKIQT